MEQIMTYVKNESNSYSNSDKLRYIVYNTISLIPQFNGLDIGVNIGDSEDPHSYFEYFENKNLFIYSIAMTAQIDFFEYDNTFEYKGALNYFNMMGIEHHEIHMAKYLFVCLYELGYIDDFYTNRDRYSVKSIIDNMYKEATKIAYDKLKYPHEVVAYMTQPGELYADKFAFMYFQYIWNNLKIRNLI